MFAQNTPVAVVGVAVMPVAPAAYRVLLGWSYLDTRGVDVVSHGNDEVAPSPYLGMGFEPVFPLDERKGRLDCFPNFPIPLPEGFERACHVAFIDDFHCYIFFCRAAFAAPIL